MGGWGGFHKSVRSLSGSDSPQIKGTGKRSCPVSVENQLHHTMSKKGNLSDTNSFKGISLMPFTTKTLNRIQPEVERLRDNQKGFRDGRSNTSHILMMMRKSEGARTKEGP